MEGYFSELFGDRRFQIAGAVAIGSILIMVVSMVIGRVWAVRVAEFVFLPLLVLSVGTMFFLLGSLVRRDYLERKSGRGGR